MEFWFYIKEEGIALLLVIGQSLFLFFPAQQVHAARRGKAGAEHHARKQGEIRIVAGADDAASAEGVAVGYGGRSDAEARGSIIRITLRRADLGVYLDVIGPGGEGVDVAAVYGDMVPTLPSGRVQGETE